MNIESFRGSAGPSLGVELEFQIVDAESLALTGAADKVIESIPESAREFIGPEFFRCCVEINTGVCRDVDEVDRDLSATISATNAAARQHGVLLAWGGTHPFSHWRDQPVVPDPRYLELAGHYGETLCRQLTFGMHVHVGVPDGDAAVHVSNRMSEHLPALLAISANSPFWCGRATGLHSHRVEVMNASPTGGLPPALANWNEYSRLVAQLSAVGVIHTAKDLWWDVRPSPSNGTVEVRMCDMPHDLNAVLGLTALIQCLVADLARNPIDEPALDECGKIVVHQNRWRAARFGLNAEFVDPRTGRKATAREVIREQVHRLRDMTQALGCSHHMDRVMTMADGPSGAERQLAVFATTGDLVEVTRSLIHPPEPASPSGHAILWPVPAVFHAERVPAAIH